jgi:hypothetical protein
MVVYSPVLTDLVKSKRNETTHNFLSYKTLYDQEYLELSTNH